VKRQHKLLVIVGAVITVIAIGVAGWYLFLRPSQPQGEAPYNPYSAAISTLLKEGPPEQPVEKAIYYAQLAENYERLGNYDATLTNFLQAQAIVDSNKLNDQITYYAALAEVYNLKHDTTNTKLYLNKQLDQMRAFLKIHPNDDATIKAIKAAEDRLKSL
jgi:hypothetical protein